MTLMCCVLREKGKGFQPRFYTFVFFLKESVRSLKSEGEGSQSQTLDRIMTAKASGPCDQRALGVERSPQIECDRRLHKSKPLRNRVTLGRSVCGKGVLVLVGSILPKTPQQDYLSHDMICSVTVKTMTTAFLYRSNHIATVYDYCEHGGPVGVDGGCSGDDEDIDDDDDD
ncbi:Hypothetical predicted protein [Scomber scombrus]|uniref:Uncharacterized protein n=1 Tax=Scomber scombrus TaxID=13677 RepID=A0AAV1PRZ1_SCOSC